MLGCFKERREQLIGCDKSNSASPLAANTKTQLRRSNSSYYLLTPACCYSI